jgi:hypothetical protein
MCSEKILRLLHLFFVAIYVCFCTWYRAGELWLAPGDLSLLEISEPLVAL